MAHTTHRDVLRSAAAASVLAALGARRRAEAPEVDLAALQEPNGAAPICVMGLVLVTAPGAGPRVAARLALEPELTLAGGDGDAHVGAIWEGTAGAGIDALARRLLAADPELLEIVPVFNGGGQEPRR